MHGAFDTAYFHHICIVALYAATAVLLFVFCERLVYFTLLSLRARRLGAVVKRPVGPQAEKTMRRRDLLTSSLAEYIAALKRPVINRARLEDLSAALFIKVTGRIGARLWLLDTIVTAAPLLGLLGTILGIMDTFNALSGGGISDPAAVSRGIAAALLATAIGIGTALFGLLGHNILHRLADHLGDEFKQLILLAENVIDPATVAERPDATVNAVSGRITPRELPLEAATSAR